MKLRTVTSSGSGASIHGYRKVSIILLNKDQMTINVEPKARVQDLFSQVISHLGLRETEYFGLAMCLDGAYQFLDMQSKVSKIAPKSWKSAMGCDKQGRPVLTLYFRVQFYVDSIGLLRERGTRHLYYQQLKENLVNYSQLCNEERCFLLASYAMQADYGSHHGSRVAPEGYFDPREYFPAWVITKYGTDYIENQMPLIHQSMKSMTKTEAAYKFITESSISPAAHNLHFYRLKKRKPDPVEDMWLGICAKGIEIFKEEADGFKMLTKRVLWANIARLHFDKRKFEIRVVDSQEKFSFLTPSDDLSKSLLDLCQEMHQFHLAIQPRIREIKHLEAEDRKHKEKYVYSSQLDLANQQGAPVSSSMLSLYKGSLTDRDPRFSVISNTSSNTTSGIASDKVISESEDDRSFELLLDSPRKPSYSGSRDSAVPDISGKRQASKMVSSDSGQGSSAPVSPDSSCAIVTALTPVSVQDVQIHTTDSNRSTPCPSRNSTPSTVTATTTAVVYSHPGNSSSSHSNTNSDAINSETGDVTDGGYFTQSSRDNKSHDSNETKTLCRSSSCSSLREMTNEFNMRHLPNTITINDYGKLSGMDYSLPTVPLSHVVTNVPVLSQNQCSKTVGFTPDVNPVPSDGGDMRSNAESSSSLHSALIGSRVFSASTPILPLVANGQIHTDAYALPQQQPLATPGLQTTHGQNVLTKSQRAAQRVRPHTLDNCYIPAEYIRERTVQQNGHLGIMPKTMTVHSRPVVTKHFATGPTVPPKLPPRNIQYNVLPNKYSLPNGGVPSASYSGNQLAQTRQYHYGNPMQGITNNYSASNLGHLANPNLPLEKYRDLPVPSNVLSNMGQNENIYVNYNPQTVNNNSRIPPQTVNNNNSRIPPQTVNNNSRIPPQTLIAGKPSNVPYSANRKPRGPLAGNSVGVYSPPKNTQRPPERKISDPKMSVLRSSPVAGRLSPDDSVVHPKIEEIRGQLKGLPCALPLISALCNDTSLVATTENDNNCSCHGSTEVIDQPCTSGCLGAHGQSPQYASSLNVMSSPMTPNRPISWHSENDLNLSFTLSGSGYSLVTTARPDPPYQAPPSYTYHQASQIVPMYSGLPINRNSAQYNPSAYYNLGGSNPSVHQMLPSRLSSGGHSSQGSDNMQHNSAYGMA